MSIKNIKNDAVEQGLKFAKQEGFDHQKIMQFVLEEYNNKLDMTEDQLFEFCHDVADKVEELI